MRSFYVDDKKFEADFKVGLTLEPYAYSFLPEKAFDYISAKY